MSRSTEVCRSSWFDGRLYGSRQVLPLVQLAFWHGDIINHALSLCLAMHKLMGISSSLIFQPCTCILSWLLSRMTDPAVLQVRACLTWSLYEQACIIGNSL